jgi:hypothetical protein
MWKRRKCKYMKQGNNEDDEIRRENKKRGEENC